MNYSIVSDFSGRIRFRCGQNAFSLEESYAIIAFFKEKQGIADVQASHLTGSILIYYSGEPLAVHKKKGASVFAGTVVEEGELLIQVRALHNDTRISQIVDMIENAEQLKAGIQGRAERMADKIVPFSFLLAGLVGLITRSPRKAVSVLLVDYSCAIKLATPISVISAMHEASTRSIMVKGGKFLEEMAEADTIVFDKTGTLTVASPEVSKVLPFYDFPRDEVLRLAACLEEHFPHSVARAIVRKAKEEGLFHEEEHAKVSYVVAHGIASTLHDKRVVIGSKHFVCDDEKIKVTIEQAKQIDEESAGDSVIYLGVDGLLVGVLFINDPPKPEAADAITKLKETGVKEIIMLTGDSEDAAKTVSRALGIDSYRAQVLPEDKAQIIRDLKKQGRRVIMVGDGINDSPALAEANVSISMKDASDIAKEVADITLLHSDLTNIVLVRMLGKRLMRRIKANYTAIITFNTLLLVFGLGGFITPNTSALMHNASTMLISALSMRPLIKE